MALDAADRHGDGNGARRRSGGDARIDLHDAADEAWRGAGKLDDRRRVADGHFDLFDQLRQRKVIEGARYRRRVGESRSSEVEHDYRTGGGGVA